MFSSRVAARTRLRDKTGAWLQLRFYAHHAIFFPHEGKEVAWRAQKMSEYEATLKGKVQQMKPMKASDQVMQTATAYPSFFHININA